MRFISHIRQMSVQIQAGRGRPDGLGNVTVVVPNIIAQFTPGGLNVGDLEFAREQFEEKGELNGRTTLLDEVTLSPLLNRLSTFDTEDLSFVEEMTQLDDEFGAPTQRINGETFATHKQLVEAKLIDRGGPGKDFQQITEIKVDAPWPRYLEFAGTFEELAQKVVDDGYDIRQVLAFERQNLNRPELVELYEMLQRDEAAEAAEGAFVEA